MFGMLKKLFGNRRASWKHTVSDPVLGEMVLCDDGDWWESIVVIDGHRVRFEVGGKREPSPALISHAHDIVREFAAFSRTVSEFLAAEAIREPDAADEIRQLTLESMYLFWPNRPNDGMLYFHGPNEYRVWRCDYVSRQPVGLGFDS